MNGCGVFRGYPFNGLQKDGYEWYASAVRKFGYANSGYRMAGYGSNEYMETIRAAEICEEFPGSELLRSGIIVRYYGNEYRINLNRNRATGDIEYDVTVSRPGSKCEIFLVGGSNIDYIVYIIRSDMLKDTNAQKEKACELVQEYLSEESHGFSRW